MEYNFDKYEYPKEKISWFDNFIFGSALVGSVVLVVCIVLGAMTLIAGM